MSGWSSSLRFTRNRCYGPGQATLPDFWRVIWQPPLQPVALPTIEPRQLVSEMESPDRLAARSGTSERAVATDVRRRILLESAVTHPPRYFGGYFLTGRLAFQMMVGEVQEIVPIIRINRVSSGLQMITDLTISDGMIRCRDPLRGQPLFAHQAVNGTGVVGR